MRADAFWSRFTADPPVLELNDDVLQMAWSPHHQWQAVAHDFAIGPPSLMLPYLVDFIGWSNHPFNNLRFRISLTIDKTLLASNTQGI